MPLVAEDSEGPSALAELGQYVEKCGGCAAALASFRTELHSRSSGDTTDRYFFDEAGTKFRSKAEVARYLNLAGAPAKVTKGAMKATLQTGETLAEMEFDWPANADGDLAFVAAFHAAYQRPAMPEDQLRHTHTHTPPPKVQGAPTSDGGGGEAGTTAPTSDGGVASALPPAALPPAAEAMLPSPSLSSEVGVVATKKKYKPKARVKKRVRSFEASALAFTIEGDFREYESVPASEAVAKRKSQAVPKRWRPLSDNVYIHPARRPERPPPHEWPKCNCVDGCGDACVNRQLFLECAVGHCRGAPFRQHVAGGGRGKSCCKRKTPPRKNGATTNGATAAVLSRRASFDDLNPLSPRRSCSSVPTTKKADGDRLPCLNTTIQRNQYPPMEIFDAGKCGFGLRCLADVTAGRLLGEYRGEVITADELRERKRQRTADDPFYFAALGDGLFVDAEKRGAYARFANHSCDPNCTLEKWTVGEEPRLVLTAVRDIPRLEELCYDYNAGGGNNDATVGQTCNCGAANCAGKIGAKTDKNKAGLDPPLSAGKKRGRPPSASKKNLKTDANDDALEASSSSRSSTKKKKKKQKTTHGSSSPSPQAAAPAKDGPSSVAWACRTWRLLASAEDAAFPTDDDEEAALELAAKFHAAASRHQALSELKPGRKKKLHCFCRLPEFSSMPESSASNDLASALVRCVRCETWYHPTCACLASVPEGDFLCAVCSHDLQDPGPLLDVARGGRGPVWRRQLPRATRDAVRFALRDAADNADDAASHTALALDFLGVVLTQADDWATAARTVLLREEEEQKKLTPDQDTTTTKDALVTKKLLVTLAEAICQGRMLDVFDDELQALMTQLQTRLTTKVQQHHQQHQQQQPNNTTCTNTIHGHDDDDAPPPAATGNTPLCREPPI